jgi:peptide-methionine (S)-S-oxide reductase
MEKEATFGAGCFWCVEACFNELIGVISVDPGYAGGAVINPSYKEVCEGTTGHAEVIRVVFDDEIISFDELLEVFWFVHDPTQLNRQGNDVGSQYRSVIFYHDDIQKGIAENVKQNLSVNKVWNNPIVTEISQASLFYVAEDYHQNYFNQNGDQPYCQIVIKPKMDKFLKTFKEKLN